MSGSWDTFIHIDGFQRRFNGDHPTLAAVSIRSIFRAWGTSSSIVTSFRSSRISAPAPITSTSVFLSGSRRMEVKRGRHDDDRADAGTLAVE